MEVDSPYEEWYTLLFHTEPNEWHTSLRMIKNAVIGNNKRKTQLLNIGIVPRLIQFMLDESTPIEIRNESAIILNSLAQGSETDVQTLIDAGVLSVLFKDITHNELKYVESCLRCLRTLCATRHSPVDALYQDPTVVPHLINILSKSTTTQECITMIFSNCCVTPAHQATLCSHGILQALSPLLTSNTFKVILPTLRCFSQLCYQNEEVSNAVDSATYNGEPLPKLLGRLQKRDKTEELQIQAAKCLTYMFRANAKTHTEQIVKKQTLPTLIRMCKEDRSWEERVEGAETLAYLIEEDEELQKTASYSDRIIITLAQYFKYPGQPVNTRLMPRIKDDITVGNELRQAAFKAYASLAANDEDIRRRVVTETDGLLEQLVHGLSDPVMKVQCAAVRCLLSLTRSVQNLRTIIEDHAVWKPIVKMLETGPDDVMVVASATLCNMVISFAAATERMMDEGILDLLLEFTTKENPAVRLNGVWALMNLTFQDELNEPHIPKTPGPRTPRRQILERIDPNLLISLMCSDYPEIKMKTLGLMRNLLNAPTDGEIDAVVNRLGNEIMQAVIMVLEGEFPTEMKEQALCVLRNMASGDLANKYIIDNEDILTKITAYLVHSEVKLQIAALDCVKNMIEPARREAEKVDGYKEKLRGMGITKLLHQLLSAKETILYDKAKQLLNMF